MTRLTIRVQPGDFDIAAEVEAISRDDRNVGAVVTFSGVCRDENGRLSALELEHYEGMAEVEIARIADDASHRWPLNAVTVIHRTGVIPVGENIVLVVTASAHRHAAFEASAFLVDYLKTRAPFWKREHGPDAKWVEARREDDSSTTRWGK